MTALELVIVLCLHVEDSVLDKMVSIGIGILWFWVLGWIILLVIMKRKWKMPIAWHIVIGILGMFIFFLFCVFSAAGEGMAHM
jgi:hypothetical protein